MPGSRPNESTTSVACQPFYLHPHPHLICLATDANIDYTLHTLHRWWPAHSMYIHGFPRSPHPRCQANPAFIASLSTRVQAIAIVKVVGCSQEGIFSTPPLSGLSSSTPACHRTHLTRAFGPSTSLQPNPAQPIQ